MAGLSQLPGRCVQIKDLHYHLRPVFFGLENKSEIKCKIMFVGEFVC